MASSTCCDQEMFLRMQKAMVAPFLTKTYQLVDDPSSDLIVSWGEYETTFVVWKPPEFAKDLLPNYFKHNNFSSFVRQLNTYGFKKIVPERWEFANEHFKKGQKHLLCEIQRRKSTPQQLHHLTPYHEHITRSIYHQETQNPRSVDHDILLALTQDNERLRKRNIVLLSELTHMKNLYNDIIYFIQNHIKPVEEKFRVFLLNEDLNQKTVDHHRHRQVHIEDHEEPKSDKVKLFGVSLCGKKRSHHERIDQEVLEC
ncbi:heat stress transcription factor B-4-like [Solanum stenotomum]|uniref:heat stress transcription factor B-4-like n=1 Tax=Solanum stenotomum TaxID=172797 RepID=UPI0020D1D75A|nr:heat stress transcription factor B-4-like [Solanum stenotomum]